MKGGIDPTSIAGLFITLMVLWALATPLQNIVTGISNTFGGTAGQIVHFIPFILLIMIIGTFIDYQRSE